MQLDDIDAVLNVSNILTEHGHLDAAHTPGLIYDLLGWADRRNNQIEAGHGDAVVAPVAATASKVKRGKATESDDSEVSRVTPDPSKSDEPDF